MNQPIQWMNNGTEIDLLFNTDDINKITRKQENHIKKGIH